MINKMETNKISELIYDTLMQNIVYPQLNVEKVGDCFIEKDKGIIHIEYDNTLFKLKIKRL